MIVPRFTQEQCVIISDSGAESLLACAMASEQQQLSAQPASVILPAWWECTPEIDLMISAVDPAIVRQAGVYGLDIFPNQSVFPADDTQSLNASTIGSIQSLMLLQAAQVALAAGIRRVVWPIRVMRPETTETISQLVEQIGITVDRAILASRLASLDTTESSAVEVIIETPFVDLSNEQMLDLAADLAIPLETCWWQGGRTLPNAQERLVFWSQLTTRSSSMLEPKVNTQTRV